MPEPTRSELWWVQFDPAIGSEANKTRPAIVVNSDAFDLMRTRLVVPLTTWQARHAIRPHRVFIAATPDNGLEIDSSADALLVRSLSLERFRFRIGTVPEENMASIESALRVVFGMEAQ